MPATHTKYVRPSQEVRDAIVDYETRSNDVTLLKLKITLAGKDFGYCLFCHKMFQKDGATRQKQVETGLLVRDELFCSVACHNSFVAARRR